MTCYLIAFMVTYDGFELFSGRDLFNCGRHDGGGGRRNVSGDVDA